MGPGDAAAPGDRLVAVRLWPVSVLGAVLALAAPPASAAPPPVRSGAPISAHAMVHTCCTPLAMKERIFAEAKAMGARFIRVDVELAGIFGGGAAGPRHWARLDEVLELSRRYELPVLGILLSPSTHVSPRDAAEFGRLAGEVAAHARDTVTHWEIINEPDGSWAWTTGTPEDYARILRAAYDAIKARVPEAEVALGGLMASPGSGWIERMFATPRADAAHAFDIASVNVRDTARRLPGRLEAWRALLERYGFTGPLWVTEHGYSGEPTYQTDPAFRGGEAAQAAYLTESVLFLAQAGASEVFVTLRDNLSDRFLSEGVVAIDGAPPYGARQKPAFAAMRRLVDNWARLAAAHAERGLHEAAARRARQDAAAASRKLRAQLKLARAVRKSLLRLRAGYRRARSERARARLAREVARATRRLHRRRDQVAWARALVDFHAGRAARHGLLASERASFVAGL
jgi:hypothetical protein